VGGDDMMDHLSLGVSDLSEAAGEMPMALGALHLAEAPCSPIGMDRPRDVARELFASPALRLVKE